MMMNVGSLPLRLLSIFALCLSVSACKGMPKIEVCVGLEAAPGLLGCADERIENPAEQLYDRNLEPGDICTNPDDFNTLLEAAQRRGRR